jgi:hypothetical protein
MMDVPSSHKGNHEGNGLVPDFSTRQIVEGLHTTMRQKKQNTPTPSMLMP